MQERWAILTIWGLQQVERKEVQSVRLGGFFTRFRLGHNFYNLVSLLMTRFLSSILVLQSAAVTGRRKEFLIGIVVLDKKGNPQSSTNQLGEELLNLKNCNGRGINLIKLESNGN